MNLYEFADKVDRGKLHYGTDPLVVLSNKNVVLGIVTTLNVITLYFGAHVASNVDIQAIIDDINADTATENHIKVLEE